MSYHIVKKIKIDGNKVFITGADNNVYPRTPHEWQCTYAEKWRENGYPSLEVCLMDAYESGNFQGAENKYTRALEALRNMPEYKAYNWRLNGYDWEQSSKNRQEDKQGLYVLLEKALKTKLPGKRYAIIKMINGTPAYFRMRKGAGICKWYYEKSKATLFRFQEDAEVTKKYFTNSQSWIIQKLK